MNTEKMETAEVLSRAYNEKKRIAVYAGQIEEIIRNILHDGDGSEIRRLTRLLETFTESLRNDCAVSPRFVDMLDDRITTHPHFQSMLLDIVLTYVKSGKIEEFLRLSMEYPTIFRIREAIFENDAIQLLIQERLRFMEENRQYSTIEMLRSYLKE